MRIAIVHDSIGASAAPDARDVIVQADAVTQALEALGHTVLRVSCGLDLSAVQNVLQRENIKMVFNLVESIEGCGRLIHLLPFCLDAMAIPYTGASAEAMLLTSNKTMSKAWMAAAGIPTPAWIGTWPPADDGRKKQGQESGTWIIKSVWEHASIGLGAHSLIENAGPQTLPPLLESRAGQLGGACFAERFIPGREFNISLLAGCDAPEVLPPAEIVFEGFSGYMPRIVDYRAKWDPTAFEYHHTPRRFAFDPADRALLARLKDLSLRCWHHFGLDGYARVDFRVDTAGDPWVLEINANPCLSTDAGFAAALDQAGIAYPDAIARILAPAMPPNQRGYS
jgi:D-alanine-D-alanine ligase